jgi:hypothetical protein
VHDTWAARDLPVLDATVSLLEQSYMVTVTDIAARSGLEPSVVARALEALDPVYVDFRKTTTGGDPRFWYVFKVTPEARRAVGQWPTAEALASRLAAELTAAAQHETDAERQGLLAYAARLVGDTLREATVRAAAEVLAPAFGGTPVPEMGQPVPEPEPQQELDFPSLVPLPELPELLRPERPGPAATHASERASEPEDERDPEPAYQRAPDPAPERAAEDERAPEPATEQPSAPAGADRIEPAAVHADLNPWPEPAPVVSDLNPWPEPARAAEPEATAQELAPLPEPGPFRSSLTADESAATVSARPASSGASDPDAADTDMDLVDTRDGPSAV